MGDLGKQFVVVSKKAFNELKFIGFENATSIEYYVKRKARDIKARNEYFKTTKRNTSIKDDIFIIDIIRKGLKNGDEIL